MFNMDELCGILNKMGVELSDDTNELLELEDDLDIDSQEVVELIAEIKDTQKIPGNKIFIKRNDTLQDVIKKVNCLSGEFEFERTDQITLNCDLDTIKSAIWSVEKWEQLLSHIEKIEVLKEDNLFQEFFMEVKNERGTLRVKSNRTLMDDKIYFNQPVPPQYLDVHKGIWEFEKQNDNATLVKLTHRWIVSKEAEKYFSEMKASDIPEIIDRELKQHAEKTLNMWKEVLNG